MNRELIQSKSEASPGVLHQTIAKSAGVVAIFTTLSRIAGLVRDVVTFHVFGANATTDAFFVAFTIPNMLRRIVAEGALTVAFIPVYSEVRQNEGEAEARRFYASTLGILMLVLVLIVLLGVIFSSYLVYAFASGFADNVAQMRTATLLTQVMFPYVFFISLVALFMGVLNSHQHFAVPAASPILLNVAMIGSTLWLSDYLGDPIFALALGVVLGGVLQLLIQIPVLKSYGLLVRPTIDFKSKAIRKLLRVMFPSLFGIAVYQLNLIVLRQLGSYLPAGQITYYYNADRLMQLALGIFAISIATAALPSMSKQTAVGNDQELMNTWRFSTKLTNFITIPAMFGLIVVGLPIVSTLYFHGQYNWHDVQWTAYATMAFAPGLVSIAMTRSTVQVFYALKDLRSPVIVAAMSVVVNSALGLLLLRYEVVGLALSLTLSSWFQTFALMLWLRYRMGKLGGRKLLSSMALQTFLSIAMSLVAWFICLSADWSHTVNLFNVVVLFSGISAAIFIYALGSLLFKLDEALLVRDLLKRKLHL